MFFNKSKRLLQEKEKELELAQSKLAEYQSRYSNIIDKDAALDKKSEEIKSLQKVLEDLNDTYQNGLRVFQGLQTEISLYQESLDVGSFGLYKPQFSFETSEKFKIELNENYERQKQLIKLDKAVICNTEWVVRNSKAEGKKMTNQFKKLMLFAFNGECEGLIAKVKWNNASKTKERILKAFESINRLGITQDTFISDTYLNLKLKELALTYEYEQLLYEEKEEQKRIREQMREEEKAQREIERAQKEAEDEERRFQKALEKARNELKGTSIANAEILNEQIKLLEQKLQEAHEKKERAIAMAQLTKIGHIYIVSNLGSFGQDIYKIGMTRRLDPLDRVRELGDASVPFQFDVHAIIYSDNAPQLEYELHKNFHGQRLNRMNHKKEFFKVSLEEIEAFVNRHSGATIEFTKLVEAREYRETLALIEQINKIAEDVEITLPFPKSLI